MSEFWKENGEAIEQTVIEITGLSFVENSIKCYLNTQFSISDPLSLKIENIEDMKDNLIHELIHVLFTQNEFGKTEKWQNLMEMYKNEEGLTKVHIPVQRIHYLITKKLFPTRLTAIVEYTRHSAYIKAWNLIKDPHIVDSILELKVV